MDYLSKKAIFDQTEKLALSRISSKIEISIEQVDASITRLCSKNLIRKIYFQDKVGFELTPKGISALEILAKVETDRITRQLQDAIHLGQKAKLRSRAISKMKSSEDKWQNYQMPDTKLIGNIEEGTIKLLAETKEIKNKQPSCQERLQNYDKEFLLYKPIIEKLIVQNNDLTKAVNNYARINDCLLAISIDIENINKTINKYDPIEDATSQVSQLKNSLCKIKQIQVQLETFDKATLLRFDKFKTQLGENSRILEILKKSTHEFVPIKRGNLEITPLYSETEGPIKDGHKTSGYSLIEKCVRCGLKRKSTTIDIG